MLYRWREPNNVLMMTDFANAFLGEDLFLLGGHPSLKDEDLEGLAAPGILTMALNNVPYVFPNPTFWLTADKPSCYGAHFYHRPDIIKFARLDTSLDKTLITDRVLRTLPNLYFYELNEKKYNDGNFLTEGVDVAWWKSVFPIALQLAWRLGFRRVFLVGCAFWGTLSEPYAWPAKITEAQKTSNQLVYNSDVSRLRALLPHFDAMGFKVYSCTMNSQANEFLDFLTLGDALAEVARFIPAPTPLRHLAHSSQTL